jgi:hypothetical protein
MVRCRHELGQGWVVEDSILRQHVVGNIEVEAFCPIVVPSAEGDGQANLPMGVIEPFVTLKNNRVGMSR